jgi:hypothetical protein
MLWGDPRINILDVAADHEPDDLGELASAMRPWPTVAPSRRTV